MVRSCKCGGDSWTCVHCYKKCYVDGCDAKGCCQSHNDVCVVNKCYQCNKPTCREHAPHFVKKNYGYDEIASYMCSETKMDTSQAKPLSLTELAEQQPIKIRIKRPRSPARAPPALPSKPDLISGWKTTLPVTRVAASEIGDLFNDMKLLGSGAFGMVYKTTLRRAIANQPIGATVAVKVQQLSKMDSKQIDRLRVEIEILKNAEACHPYVNKIYDVLYNAETKQLFFVLEYLSGTELWKLSQTWAGRRTEDKFISYVFDLIEGLQCLHERGIAHRDIKPENVMITDQNKAVWIDFGLSCSVPTGCNSEPVGTLATIAPEVLCGYTRTPREWKQADYWSFGCMLYELATGKEFPAQERLQQELKRNHGACQLLQNDAVAQTALVDRYLGAFSSETFPITYGLLTMLLQIDPAAREEAWINVVLPSMKSDSHVMEEDTRSKVDYSEM